MVHVQRPIEVDGHHLVPEWFLGLQEEGPGVPAGIVDQHLDRAQFVLDTFDRHMHPGVIGDVDAIAAGATARCLDLTDQTVSGVGIEVEHRNHRAFFGEAFADGAANAAGTAGHYYDLFLQSFHLEQPQ
ncbi:hypothetical protein D9M71_805090 [compost metagenome]